MNTNPDEANSQGADFAERVRHNQQQLGAELRSQYDFIVCGWARRARSVARRLAENPAVSVLLLEAGGQDDVPEVMRAEAVAVKPGQRAGVELYGPTQPTSMAERSFRMGKVLGGGSSINVMICREGTRMIGISSLPKPATTAWSYKSVLNIYRRIEDWHGAPDPTTAEPAARFTSSPPLIQPGRTRRARRRPLGGIPTFENQNGRMMEGAGGASIFDLRARDGCRQSVFRSYVFPYMDRPNLTVLHRRAGNRLTFDRSSATWPPASSSPMTAKSTCCAGSEVCSPWVRSTHPRC